MAFVTAQVHEDPSADFKMTVDVQQTKPEAVKPGGSLLPRDARRQASHELEVAAGEDLARQRASIAAERRKLFLEGKEVPDEQRPETIGQMAHQLMQSGDYGDGPPFPLENAPEPAWHRKGPELAMEVKEVERTKLGSGESAELIRCFVGNEEHPCPGNNPNPACVAEESLAGAGTAELGGTGLTAILISAGGRRRSRANQMHIRTFL